MTQYVVLKLPPSRSSSRGGAEGVVLEDTLEVVAETEVKENSVKESIAGSMIVCWLSLVN